MMLTRDIKPYRDYKETDQKWLGVIPSHWDLYPNRAIFSEVKDRNHPDEEMLSVTIKQGVIRQKTLLEGSSKKDASNLNRSAYKLVQPNDIAYNKMRAWQGAVGFSSFRGIISPAYVVMRLRDEALRPEYFHHLFRTPGFAKEAERWSYGITSDMWSLRPEHFKMIYSPIPPIPEQVAIIKFLAWGNQRLDKAIRAKKKLIGLLNEQKQAIIHRAVTRGLDPSVPFNNTGIPWFGDIPAHWDLRRIGYLGKVGNGSTPSRSEVGFWENGAYPWLNSSQVNRGFIDSANQFVTTRALKECHLPIVASGSILIAITGQGKTRGLSAILGMEATVNQHIAYITPRRDAVCSEYLRLVMVSVYQILRSMSDDAGSTKGAITCESLKRFKIPVPPFSEQLAISNFIINETNSIDVTHKRLERELELLREYRMRLVYDVVTGKLDVREVSAGLPIEYEDVEDVSKDKNDDGEEVEEELE